MTDVTMFLCGDVMTGRGIDQILAHPNTPELQQAYVRDAREYVRLAEHVNGAIPAPVDPSYIWGDALEELARVAPAARIINLETSVTRSADCWPGKGIHYRMHPDNAVCLTIAGVDVCVLANNHVLDYGRIGLGDTIRTLQAIGIATTGAGDDLGAAVQPAVLEISADRRILVPRGRRLSPDRVSTFCRSPSERPTPSSSACAA